MGFYSLQRLLDSLAILSNASIISTKPTIIMAMPIMLNTVLN
jgi:hypothetical protein